MVIFVCSFENWSSQDKLQMELARADIHEAVRLTRRYDERLTRIYSFASLVEPYFGNSIENGQNLLDSMVMRRGASSRFTPLMEETELA
jgi:energy-coupling factor transporter transmembrane protein EcfT